MPEYADDILDDIADLERSQAGQFGSGQKRQPITKASAGWELPSRSTPSPPASGAHLYASGSTLRWRSSNGSDYSLIPPTVPQGVAVDNPDAMSAGSAPGSYNQAYVQALRDDIAEVRAQLIALLDSLRGSSPGIIHS